ncbi:MAG: NAD(P)-binding domain-containing protein [Alphaproteobacteria bacterium]|nr:NAD(P)-binding domain-containing protein [Alphaproteobacteria bacterium]
MTSQPTSAPTVLLLDHVGPETLAQYTALAGAHGLTLQAPESDDRRALDALVPAADVLLVRRRPLDAALLRRAVAARAAVAVGRRVRCCEDELSARGIALVRLPRLTAMAVADLVLALILGITRSLVQGHSGVADSAYRTLGLTPKQTSETCFAFDWLGLDGDAPLYGRTLGLVGLGEIGALTAERANAFGMTVRYFQRTRLSRHDESALNVEFRPFEELLKTSDVLSLHVPDTAQTRDLIDADALSLMRRGAYLVNTSRGRVVNEDALIAHLKAGALAGAALDVFGEEPLPADSGLIGLPNVLLTPHLGGGAPTTLTREMNAAFDRIASIPHIETARAGMAQDGGSATHA